MVRLPVPPLRDRREELPELAAALLRRLARRFRLAAPRLSQGALDRLARHDWPGNVRELESVLAGVLLRHPDTPLLGPETVAGPLPAPPESRTVPANRRPKGCSPCSSCAGSPQRGKRWSVS